MTQPRRPAGTPIGGQFAPTNRPEATGIELVDDNARLQRVEATVSSGIPTFAVVGLRSSHQRETRDRWNKAGSGPVEHAVTATPVASTTSSETESARTPEAERRWRLFRESYGGWLDQYRKSVQIGGRSEAERRLREAAGLAGVSEAQLRHDKARAYKGETSEQILDGR